MKKTARYISLILASLMILALLVGCAETTDPNAETTLAPAETAAPAEEAAPAEAVAPVEEAAPAVEAEPAPAAEIVDDEKPESEAE